MEKEKTYAFPESIYRMAKVLIPSQRSRERVLFAVLALFFDGIEPEQLNEKEAAAWYAIAGRVAASKRNSENRTKPQTTTPTKPVTETPTEHAPEGEGVGDIDLSIDKSIEKESSFSLACLAALNEELGTCYSTLPGKCAMNLLRLQGNYTVDEVRDMIRFKRDEWRNTQWSKNLTPNTLFSPDHFEQYIHQSKANAKEVADYAKYD